MKVAITGATGLIGTTLVRKLTSLGHEVVRLVRRDPVGSDVLWQPDTGKLDAQRLAGCDGVVHLAGESIATGRWTGAKKARIFGSRKRGTDALSRGIAGLPEPQRPRVLVSASAVGYYGDRADEICTEESPPGDTFLSDVCVAWEAAAQPARDAGVRVVHPRLGVVLSPRGGALKPMLIPFRLGVGGRVGNGRQYMSWIALRDAVGVLIWALEHPSLEGPVNAVAPHAVTNAEFTRILGHVLGRPTIVPLPTFMARLAMGEMADELLLASARVVPQVLERNNFSFQDPRLEAALQSMLGAEPSPV